jgi:hypothetical protein
VSFNHEPDPAYRCFRSSTAISAATSSGASSYARALLAQFHAQPPAALQHNGRRPILTDTDRKAGT